MKKHLFLTSLVALVATVGVANAEITSSDISAINNSINMQQSDGNYITSKGNFNAETTDYSTVDGYGLYTYDHDNNPETPEIPLTTNDGSEALDNAVFTYTDNYGATTNLGDNATGFTTSDFTDTAGTIDVADGTTDLTTLEANTTTVGLGNYQYMANFDNSGDALTALTADAPELSSFHNDITLTTGAITVNGNDEVNKPSIDQYGFTVDLHDGSTGNFDLVYNESTHLYSYNYNGDVVLDAADIAAADAQVASQSANLIADTTLFNNAVATNTTNYNSAVGHYNNVHSVYESDTNVQTALNDGYDTYATSFANAQANQADAAQNLSDAQDAYAADLEIYTPIATAYNNYKYSLGKSIDAKDEAVLASAATDASNKANTAEQNAKDYADDAIDASVTNGSIKTALDGKQAVLTTDQQAAVDSGITATKVSAYDSAVTNMGKVHGLITADSNGVKTFNGTNATASTRLDDNGNYVGDLAVGTTVEDHLVSLDNAIGDEAATRAAADTTLQANIDAEATARQNADTALQAAINNINTASVTAVQGLNDRVTANTQAIAGLDNKVDTLEKNVSGGVAAATALSAVEVSNVKKGEMSVGGGYGYYNSQSAMALGAALGLSDNWSVNAGAGIANGDKTQVSFRAGTNYKFKLF